MRDQATATKWKFPIVRGAFSKVVMGGLVDLVCFSHLRWQFVYQRPQHLLTRAAADRRVIVIEEPRFEGSEVDVRIDHPGPNVWVATPLLPPSTPSAALIELQRACVDMTLRRLNAQPQVLWYYTPMALEFSRHVSAPVVVYDCMDELSLFKQAPPQLKALERELFERAHLVFTGGRSLYEAKRGAHSSLHCFPSSVEVGHFRKARQPQPEPIDQASIPRPRLGYFGVIDERIDLELIAELADARRDWQLVLVGPLAKIEEADLPRRENIHYLGQKPYAELPAYLAGWDAALMPFALNDATRFISPTKTPEYLAAGRPVVSTPIRDVVATYGEFERVAVAEDAPGFQAAVESLMAQPPGAGLARVDALLAEMSWDRTWAEMDRLIEQQLERSELERSPLHSTVRARRARPAAGAVA